LHALAKLAPADEGIELLSLSGRVRNLTAELSASAVAKFLSKQINSIRAILL